MGVDVGEDVPEDVITSTIKAPTRRLRGKSRLNLVADEASKVTKKSKPKKGTDKSDKSKTEKKESKPTKRTKTCNESGETQERGRKKSRASDANPGEMTAQPKRKYRSSGSCGSSKRREEKVYPPNDRMIYTMSKFMSGIDAGLELDQLKKQIKDRIASCGFQYVTFTPYWTRPSCTVRQWVDDAWKDCAHFSWDASTNANHDTMLVIACAAAVRCVSCLSPRQA